MKRYAIWDKVSPIITPIMEVLTPDQWKERYPAAALDHITVICAAGEINGGFYGTLGQMVEMYTNMGCDFSNCFTAEDKLAAIEAFEDAKEAEAKAAANAVSTDERIAAALEAQVMMKNYKGFLK